jgi:hypothetical protein
LGGLADDVDAIMLSDDRLSISLHRVQDSNRKRFDRKGFDLIGRNPSEGDARHLIATGELPANAGADKIRP